MNDRAENIIGAVIRAELDAAKIQKEDEELIKAYITGSEYGEPEASEPEEEERPSLIYKHLSTLAHAKDIEPDPFLIGLSVMGEEKWSNRHRQAAWTAICMTHANWFKSRGYDISNIPFPGNKAEAQGEWQKNISLDSRTNGFVVRFRGLKRDEHLIVLDAIKRIPGWKFHDGKRPLSRLKEPHYTIPGDQKSAEVLRWYLTESQQFYAMQRDAEPARAAYWSGMIESHDWTVDDQVLERIDFLVNRAEKIVAMSEAHHPSATFKLRHEYESVDGAKPFDYQIAGVEYILACTQESRYSKGLAGNGVFVADPMGCISGDAIIHANRAGRGFATTIRKLYESWNGWDKSIPTKIRVLANGELRQHTVRNVIYAGVKNAVEVTLASGKKLILTPDHEIAQPNNKWTPAADLNPGDIVLTNGELACRRCGSHEDIATYKYAKFIGYCKKCICRYLRNDNTNMGKCIDGDGYVRISGQWDHHRAWPNGQVYEHILVMEEQLGRKVVWPELIHHKNGVRHDNRAENLELLSPSDHHKRHKRYLNLDNDWENRVRFLPIMDRVKSVESVGPVEVYDIVMDDPYRNFVANGIIVHNCGKSLEAGIMAVVEGWLEEVERDPSLALNDLKALILCPAAAKIGWRREISRWLDSLGFTAQIMRGMSPQPVIANFVIVNPQLLKKEFNKDLNVWQPTSLFTILLAQRWFAIVADESHMYKEFRSQRTASAIELFSGKRWDDIKKRYVQWRLPVPMRVMLSGTPILNRPLEYASQLEALGLLESFGGQIRFENDYGYTYSWSKAKRVQKMKALHWKLRQLGYLRREKETMVLTDEQKVIPLDTVPQEILNKTFAPEDQWAEILESHGWKLLPGVLGQLPAKIRTVVPLPLTNRISYQKAEKDLFTWLMDEFGGDSANLEKQLTSAKRGYALKLISILKRLAEEGKVKAAIKWLQGFLDDSESQKIVFYTSHLYVQDQLIEAFPGAAIIRGGQSEEKRQGNIDRFQTDPNCRVILCMLQAGGQAITLTAAHHLAFLSLDWKPATHDQAEDRIWGRVNDLHGASIYYLITENTIDGMMIGVIDAKRETTMAAVQGADADTSMLSELVAKYMERARHSQWSEVFGIEEETEES